MYIIIARIPSLLCACFISEYSVNGNRDFVNATINFTIMAGERRTDLYSNTIVIQDDINEAKEQFILLIELDGDQAELDAAFEGLIIISLLDDNRTFVITIIIYTII